MRLAAVLIVVALAGCLGEPSLAPEEDPMTNGGATGAPGQPPQGVSTLEGDAPDIDPEEEGYSFTIQADEDGTVESFGFKIPDGALSTYISYCDTDMMRMEFIPSGRSVVQWAVLAFDQDPQTRLAFVAGSSAGAMASGASGSTYDVSLEPVLYEYLQRGDPAAESFVEGDSMAILVAAKTTTPEPFTVKLRFAAEPVPVYRDICDEDERLVSADDYHAVNQTGELDAFVWERIWDVGSLGTVHKNYWSVDVDLDADALLNTPAGVVHTYKNGVLVQDGWGVAALQTYVYATTRLAYDIDLFGQEKSFDGPATAYTQAPDFAMENSGPGPSSSYVAGEFLAYGVFEELRYDNLQIGGDVEGLLGDAVAGFQCGTTNCLHTALFSDFPTIN